jgi:antitoxin PrlF
MATATLTSKGQVTIPVSVRTALGLDAGSRIEFIELEKGRFAIVPVTRSIQELKGVLRKPARAVSIEDMNEAIASEAAKAARRK